MIWITIAELMPVIVAVAWFRAMKKQQLGAGAASGRQTAQHVFDQLGLQIKVNLDTTCVEKKALARLVEIFLGAVNALDVSLHYRGNIRP